MVKNRYYNYRDLPQYYEKTQQGSYVETEETYLSDTLIFGLRRLEGVDLNEIKQRHNVDVLTAFKGIQKHIDSGLVVIEDNRLKLTKKGLLLGNQVFEVFV